MAYRDAQTGILIYVESDRRHVAAIGTDGKILWHRNLVAEEGMRTLGGDANVAIHGIGKPSARGLKIMEERGRSASYVAIGFTNRFYGLLDEHSGAYTLMRAD